MGEAMARLQQQLLELDTDERRELAMQLVWSLPRSDVVFITERLSKTLQKDIVASLPAEISFQILSKLRLEDLLRCTLVSRTWASRCQDQALWSMKCLQHRPPIQPARTTWADIQAQRKIMYPPRPEPVLSIDALEDDEYEHDPISRAGGMGGGGGFRASATARPHDGWSTALRQSVWERSSSSLLPSYSTGPTGIWAETKTSNADSTSNTNPRHDPIKSHLDSPDAVPKVNYKHLFIVYQKLDKRKRYITPVMTSPPPIESTSSIPSTISSTTASKPPPLVVPKKIDAVSSIQSGGLSGHSEIIYGLQLVRHRMTIRMKIDFATGPAYDSMNDMYRPHTGLDGRKMGDPVITGRDWLLSSSRDKTMRLWALDTAEPRVVKIFHGGHDMSILSLFAFHMPPCDVRAGFEGRNDDENNAGRLYAVTGGGDGRLCLWDVEHGDGTPAKIVHAHRDSVLCVRGVDDRIVSCSRDGSIKVFALPDMVQLLSIEAGTEFEPMHGSINSIGLSENYIISGAGDKLIRIWSLQTGHELFRVSAHQRGIAAVAFDPTPPGLSRYRSRSPGGQVVGTIATGSSDATVKISNLVVYPDHPEGNERVSFEEMLEEETSTHDSGRGIEESVTVAVERRATCVAPCCCPPGLARLDNGKCERCLNRGHMELVRTVCLGGGVLLSGSYDGSVRVWDRDTGRALASLAEGHTGRVFSVVGDRMRVVSSGLDTKIMLWDFGGGLDTSFVEP